MEQPEFTLRDFIAAARRRVRMLAAVTGGIVLVAVILAIFLPAEYTSRAVILIEQQEIPPDLVRSTVTSFADQRIQVISQRVMTTSNLTEIMDKYDLYERLRNREPREVVLDTMRNDIAREMISAEVVDPRSGRPTEATIAFSLSYTSESPDLAQRVANELVSLFLNENLKERREAAAETSTFLDQEAERLREEVARLEQKLSEFKARNVENRPELERVIRDNLNRTELELSEVDRRIYAATQQQIIFEGDLAQVQPNRATEIRGVTSPVEQLRSMETQLTAVQAAYGSNHPDVRRLRRQVEAMRLEADPAEARRIYDEELAMARQSLADLSERYGPDHPDVVIAARRVDTVMSKLAAVPEELEQAPNNETYIAMRARLDSVSAEIGSLKQKREVLVRKIEQLTKNLYSIPEVEAEFRALSREYEAAVQEYREISGKSTQAALSENLEAEAKGERFALIEPPLRPEQPSRPDRGLILALGIFFGLAGGLGSVAVAEALDTRIRGRRGVLSVLEIPPLASIPYVPADEPAQRTARGWVIALIAAALGVSVVLVTIHVTYKPLDVLWFVIMRKVGI